MDDAGARYPLTIDPIIEDARLMVSDGAPSDLFGSSVAVDGDTVVVGAFGDDTSQGSAYVFVRPVAGWSGLLQESAKLIASDGEANNTFGLSVAVSGDTVVVGAHLDDGGQGSAYVFVKPAGGWAGLLQESAKLVASDGAQFDLVFTAFGESVAVSGVTVVVGAAGDDVGTNSDQGSVYVFVKPIGGWAGLLQENAKLTASDGAADNRFGFSVDASGDTVVVGTFFATSRGLCLRGAARGAGRGRSMRTPGLPDRTG